jgi:hypothetical protein
MISSDYIHDANFWICVTGQKFFGDLDIALTVILVGHLVSMQTVAADSPCGADGGVFSLSLHGGVFFT